ncbi:hypothetical protein JRG78_11830 [Microbacterium sp. EF45047]|nr:hypothetical protein JSY13_11820 [Microbacterium neungamense]WCM56922.1 hypothetical protein JRG78_11830 [Microbacterium sp. EF45047]
MRAAAELLATADVDVIAWNGTSGSWLGVDHDRAIAADVNEQVAARYAEHGIAVAGHHALGLSDNESFGRVVPESLVEPSLALAEAGPDALVYLCTNLYGAPITEQVEKRTGVPVLDSVAVTLWHCLVLAEAPLLDPKWGRLLT